MYESVLAQFEGNNETELNMSQSEDTTDQQYDNLRVGLNDTARYSAPPVQLQYLYTNTASNSVNGPINTSASASIPRATPGGMALKKNGQERNKLHLTLSLGGNDSSLNSDVSPELMPTSRPAVASADVDEPYTVMSPAGGVMP
ncbi:MAG: hypothetical protein MJE68_05475 [Proteobacteria bacterium]|nr:hypothetical protein [Pseudomonadota bacterium]